MAIKFTLSKVNFISYLEKDKIFNEVKSIQSRQSVKAQILYESKINNNRTNLIENKIAKLEEYDQDNQNLNNEMNELESNRGVLRIINNEENCENNEVINKVQLNSTSDKLGINQVQQKFGTHVEGDNDNPNNNNISNYQSEENFAKSAIGFKENDNQIVQIVKGKYHLLKLTMNGSVYASGKNYYGVVGLGGSVSALKPQIIPNLSNIKIKQIAAGVYHSLALAHNGDLYTWGLGEEGINTI